MASLVSYALTNVNDVKESLGIASSDLTWDNLITRKINQVTDAIENYCQRHFTLQQYSQEEYKAPNIDELVLKQRPLVIDGTHLLTLEWRTTAFNSNNWETIDTSLYFADINSGVINLMFNGLGYWNRYRATYYAGYATIPNDLAEATNMIVCYYVNNPSGSNIGIQERREGQRLTRFFQIPNSFRSVMEQLGVDETIDNYADTPVLTDR